VELIEAIRTRRSIRHFKADPVPKKILEELFDPCRWAPSASNTQPWEFAILGGKVLEALKARLAKKVKEEWDSENRKLRNRYPDIRQPKLTGVYLERSESLRKRINCHEIPQGMEGFVEKSGPYLLYGMRFYGAPNAIIIYTEKALYPKSLFDTGLIAGTICLAAPTYGLGTCLMTAPVFWPDILRELLPIPESKVIVLSIAIGYPDSEAPVNNFERTREPFDTFAHWHGFDIE
jgi:nitroreductase